MTLPEHQNKSKMESSNKKGQYVTLVVYKKLVDNM